jgi:hypothetical protein
MNDAEKFDLAKALGMYLAEVYINRTQEHNLSIDMAATIPSVMYSVFLSTK